MQRCAEHEMAEMPVFTAICSERNGTPVPFPTMKTLGGKDQ